MATSGSTDFSLTSRQVVSTALEVTGALQIGETASAEDAALALKHLNLMLKTWSTDPALFIRAEGSVTLVASTASYTASPVSLARRIVGARRRTSSIDTSLGEPMSRQEYLDTPNKSQTGMPVSFYFDPQRSTRTLYVWPVPDATIAASTTVRIDYHRVLEDSDSLDNDPDVPQEWLEAMIYGLAARLSVIPGYCADPNMRAEIKDRALSLVGQLRADSEEDASVFFSPA